MTSPRQKAALKAAEARRKKRGFIKMPDRLGLEHVKALEGDWPLKPGHVEQGRFAGCTNVLLFFIDAIRTGSRYNCRRVRYDGSFYVVYRGRELRFDWPLTERTFDACTIVYGTGWDYAN